MKVEKKPKECVIGGGDLVAQCPPNSTTCLAFTALRILAVALLNFFRFYRLLFPLFSVLAQTVFSSQLFIIEQIAQKNRKICAKTSQAGNQGGRYLYRWNHSREHCPTNFKTFSSSDGLRINAELKKQTKR